MSDGEDEGLLADSTEQPPLAVDLPPSRPPPRLRRALFFCTYIFYYTTNTLMGPLLPSIQTEMLFSSGTASIITTTPSWASLCGKLIWGGWPVDRFGARKTYVGSMIALAALVLCYTSTAIISSWQAVAVLAFAVEFAGCTTYPAHIQLIRGWWAADRIPEGCRLLGLSSRAANILSFALFGSLLAVLPWRSCALLAAGMALFGALVGGVFHRDRRPGLRDGELQDNIKLTPAEARAALRNILSSRRFWLAAASLASINVTKGAIEHLGAVYFRDIAPTIVSDGRAAQLAAMWPLGMLCSVCKSSTHWLAS
jgi:MFS family permease